MLRDIRADQAYFDAIVERLAVFVESDEEELTLPVDQWRAPKSLAMAAGNVVKVRWNRFSALYSQGASTQALRDEYEDVLVAAERAVLLERQYFPPELVELQFRNPRIKDYYREWLLLVSLAITFQVDDATFDRVVAAVEFGRGDHLIDCLIATRRPDHPIGADLQFPRIVGPLESAFDSADPAKLIARYLSKWYTAWKGIRGWGTHEHVPQYLYYGYWAFEVLGVVTALGVDDASFRDNEYYPRDLLADERAG
ncbi:MAG: DUF1911 domain-containing protein [Microbacterium sp.]|uniref:PoNe immunity protein domain-containing protein n=1 Tax=Microbacterium sp. TaxID=51671 RepID=UPI0039E4F910